MRTALRVLLGLAVAALVVYLLFTVVFPWVDREFLIDPTLSTWVASAR